MTKEIITTNGMICLVDDEDFVLLGRHNWYINYSGAKPYVITKLKTDQTTIWRCIFIHHMILGTSRRVDHIDGNPLNNQKSNLRMATVQENGWNTVKRMITSTGRPPTSLYKGVSKYVNTKGETLYRVQIKLTAKGVIPAKYMRLGPFKDEIEAAKRYNEAIVKIRGEWAMLNVIPDGY